MIEALAVAAGLAVLVVGGELVVRGASRLAISLGISPVVIGLTVVAFGTSSPELAVSLGSSLQGSPDVAVGNVVGSNVYNILLVLGVAALIRPLVVQQKLVWFDVPLVIGASVLFWVLALDGSLEIMEGSLLLILLGVYTVVSIAAGRRDSAEITAEYRAGISPGREDAPVPSRGRDVFVFLVGLGALVIGAQVLVWGATAIARSVGIPELVVGLTVVAIGTSLPELVTSVVAAVRGQRDLAVGNAVGSNLFNILGVLGVSAIVVPGGVPIAAGAVSFDIPVMTVVAVACLPLFFTGHLIRRWEGALFLAFGAAYTAYLVLDATQHPFRDGLADAMVWFVLPLTGLTLVLVVAAEVGRRRTRDPATPARRA
ncbi:calcium/sodium antiporter [soil metagenome]